MAKERITRSCGHAEEINLFGPYAERQRRREYEARRLCRACWARRREEVGAAAADSNAAAGLPPLEGTERQIAWAEQIRAGIIARDLAGVRTALARIADPEQRQLAERWLAAVLGQREAGWWIDRRGRTILDMMKEQQQ